MHLQRILKNFQTSANPTRSLCFQFLLRFVVYYCLIGIACSALAVIIAGIVTLATLLVLYFYILFFHVILRIIREYRKERSCRNPFFVDALSSVLDPWLEVVQECRGSISFLRDTRAVCQRRCISFAGSNSRRLQILHPYVESYMVAMAFMRAQSGCPVGLLTCVLKAQGSHCQSALNCRVVSWCLYWQYRTDSRAFFATLCCFYWLWFLYSESTGGMLAFWEAWMRSTCSKRQSSSLCSGRAI